MAIHCATENVDRSSKERARPNFVQQLAQLLLTSVCIPAICSIYEWLCNLCSENSHLFFFPRAAMVAACVVSVETQQLCGNSYYTTVVTINASSDVLTLPCIVPTTSQLPEMTFVWQWNELFPDLSVERQLPIDDATLMRNSSIYRLQNVACRTTGIYEAQYLLNTSDLNTCMYSCRFIVEVQEDRPSILVEDFSSFGKWMFHNF